MNERPKNNLSELPGKANIWSDEDGLSWLTFEQEAEISLEDFLYLIECAKKTWIETEYFRVLVDLRTNPVISAEAREFAASPELQQYISCYAILANELSMKLVGNFFINFHKPEQPTKIFVDVEQARAWLLQQQQKR